MPREKVRSSSISETNHLERGAESLYCSLAYSEASLILARLIWSFDLKLSKDCSNWADQRAYIIWDKKPLKVELVPREQLEQ